MRQVLAIGSRVAAPFALVALLIGVRNPTPLVRPGFWAEDGMEFFPLALVNGWASLYTPVYGYHFLLSRTIAYFATFFPVVHAPGIYAAGCLAFNALAIGYFSLDRFAWIIGSRCLRVLVCTLLVIAPGGGEVMMNLCNLMTPLSLLALLVLIENPTRLSYPRLLAVLGLAWSAGPVVLFLPVVIYLWWRNRDSRYLWLMLGLCPVLLANVVGNHVTGSRNGLLNYHHAVLIPTALADNFAIRLFLLPVLGAGTTARLMVQPAPVFWAAALSGATVFWALWRVGGDRDHRPLVLLLAGYACAIATFAGIAISRSYAVNQLTRHVGDPLWHVRYSYLPGAVAILLWATVFRRVARGGPVFQGLAFVGFALMATSQLGEWHNYPARRDAEWPEAAQAIQRAVNARRDGRLRDPVTLTVPVHPSHWNGGSIQFVLPPR